VVMSNNHRVKKKKKKKKKKRRISPLKTRGTNIHRPTAADEKVG
ncbi:hypothetical protein ACN42_g7749, partial [Penicillium freii]